MIRWCAYCQQFQGEAAPFDNFSLSHGICLSCKNQGLNISDEKFEFIQLLQTLQHKLWAAGKHESRDSVQALVDEAVTYNLRPVDVLIGLLAPLLYQIGEDWAVGKSTVADEHRFTAFAFDVFHTVETKMQNQAAIDPADRVQILLVNADGNHHSLGIRMLEIFLRSAGFQPRVYFPGLPAAEVAKLSLELKPEWIGISISLSDQIPSVIETVHAIINLYPAAANKIILGGYAVKSGAVPNIEGTIQTPDLGSSVAIFRKL